MNFHFICEWNKEHPEKTWSGTCYALRQSLDKFGKWNDIKIEHKVSLLHRICNKFHFWINDIDLYTLKFWNKTLKKQIKEGDVILQFAEFTRFKKSRSYIYCDLTVNYCLWLKQHKPKLFNLSNFEGQSEFRLERRCKYQEDYFNKECSGILTMGHWLKNWLVNEAGIPKNIVHHVGGGANINVPQFTPKRKGNKFLFVGIDFKRKGGYAVIEAFKIAKKQNPEIELYIIGPKTNPVLEHIEGVFYEGQKSHEQLIEYYKECDVFVLPSYFEAYGIVFVEALCFGLPCIGRNCFEMPFIIEDGITGALVPEEDNYSQLAEKMLFVLNNNLIKQNVAKNKENYLKKYSWDSVSERIISIINNSKK